MSSRLRLQRALLLLVSSVAALAPAFADPIITEFMASNSATLLDVDGDSSDWIEIYNPDINAVNLNGWYLADKASDKTKWKFPAVTLAPGGYLVVFASNKNRKDPAQQLHTNFTLSANSGYLGLIQPDGVTATTEFAPTYPAQFTDISYGSTQPTDATPPRTGYLRTATPGARNPDVILLLDKVAFSRAPGLFTGSFSLTLSGANTGQRIFYVLAPPSASGAAVAEPTTASTLYTGPITITSSTIVRAEIFPNDSKSSGLPATAQFVKLADATATFSSGLPVMVLDEHGGGPLSKDGVYHPAWLYVFTPTAGTTNLTGVQALATPSGLTVHGNFSSGFPKKSYDLDLRDTLGGDNPQPLLGLDTDRQWELYGPWATDRSYIRNAYVYALSNRIGRWAPRTKFVETFVNTDSDGLTTADYTGIAVLIDRLKISPERINIASINSTDLKGTAVTGGYLFKFDPTPDTSHYNFITDHGIPSQNAAQGGTGFIVESPDRGSLAPAQQTYVRGFVQTMENSLFEARAGGYGNRGYLDYIDVPSWVDHHLMKVFFGDVDALYHSDYFYKDRGGKMISGPVWDFDGSMGDGDPRNDNPSTWDTTGGRDVWNFDWWGQLAHDPEFMQAWIDRWQALRRNEFSSANLTGLADSLAAQIPADAAARDAARWPDNISRYPGGFLAEVARLKDWITTRSAWIDSQFVAAPIVTTSGSNVIFTAPAGAQLVYTLDGSDPRALGGGVPSYAVIASSPLSLDKNANAHVRCYRADLIAVYPGSPWSSVAGGPSSSAILARPRLSNLSILTNLAAGDSFTMGFVVGGTGTGGSKPLLARAVGPSLAQFAVPTPHPDPLLQLFAGSTKVTENNDWGGDSTISNNFSQVGAFPYTSANSKDAAVFTPAVASGSNSVVVSGVGAANGNVIAELYDATPASTYGTATPRLINVSVLKNLGDGLTVGFVVGPAGSPAKNVLIRAVGPSLGAAPFNVAGVVADPQLALFSGPNKIGENDNWGGTATLTAAFTSVGAFALPAGSRDAALVATLAPGNYTVQVQGVNGTTGIALVEVYELP